MPPSSACSATAAEPLAAGCSHRRCPRWRCGTRAATRLIALPRRPRGLLVFCGGFRHRSSPRAFLRGFPNSFNRSQSVVNFPPETC
eukprot:scaffold18864_cov68-Phaeocystis_antarctica.AAC.8